MLASAALGYKRAVPFRQLLQNLVAHAAGARGAIFCDHEGEAIDLAVARPPPRGCAELTEYELKICGAQVAAPLLGIHDKARTLGAGVARELRIVCTQGTLVCSLLPDRYYVALLLTASSGGSADALRKLARTARLVSEEM